MVSKSPNRRIFYIHKIRPCLSGIKPLTAWTNPFPLSNCTGITAIFRPVGGVAPLLRPLETTSSSTDASYRRLLFLVRAATTGSVFSSCFWDNVVLGEVHGKGQVHSKFRPMDIVLYQYEACPFCNKVKSIFLDYNDIPYKIVEVNPISKKEIKWSDHRKVLILKVDGEQMVDSTDVINKLNKMIYPDVSTDSIGQDGEEKKLRSWVDGHLVHILSPNIYRTTSEAIESFDYITSRGNFSFTERLTAKYAGAAAVYFVSKKLKKKHNISDERAALYEAAETWLDALNGRDFLGGSKPNLADLAVYGVLKRVRYLKSGRDMVEHTRIGYWYSRMENAVGVCSGSEIQA